MISVLVIDRDPLLGPTTWALSLRMCTDQWSVSKTAFLVIGGFLYLVQLQGTTAVMPPNIIHYVAQMYELAKQASVGEILRQLCHYFLKSGN